MRAVHLPSFEYQRMRWSNGLGWTREVLRASAAASPGFDWRVSIAEIDKDCDFSAFPGCDRCLVLLRGNGLRLRSQPSGDAVAVDAPHGIARFAGDDPLHCELADGGPVHAFNVIWQRSAHTVEVLHRPLVGPMLFFPEPQVRWLAYLLSGRAEVKDAQLPALEAGDSLLLEADTEAARLILSGAGELLLVRIGSA